MMTYTKAIMETYQGGTTLAVLNYDKETKEVTVATRIGWSLMPATSHTAVQDEDKLYITVGNSQKRYDFKEEDLINAMEMDNRQPA